MKNPLRLFFLSLAQLLGCINSSVGDSWENHANDGIDNIEIIGEKTIAVKTPSGLAWVSQETNKGKNSDYNCFFGYTIILLNDIDLDKYKWTPIGTSDNPFRGSFNGDGYKISNLKIGSENLGSHKKFIGLFGYIKADFYDHNVKIENISLESGEIYGGKTTEYAGAMAGYVYAYGYDVTVNITIRNCTSYVKVVGGNSFFTSAGGLVGGAEGKGEVSGSLTIENCSNFGTVTGGYSSYSHVAGIVGSGKGTGEGSGEGSGRLEIKNCINTGTIKGNGITSSYAGGIIGYGTGSGEGDGSLTVRNCKNNGYIEGGNTPSSSSAGIIGYGYGYGDGRYGYGCLTLHNCTNMGKITGGSLNSSTAGIMGEGYADGYGLGKGSLIIQYCSNNGMIIGIGSSSFTGGIISYGYGIDDSELKISNCYSASEIDALTGFVGGIAGWLQCRSTDTQVSICSSYVSGIITGGANYKGGVVGALIREDHNYPIVANCLVVIDSIENNSINIHWIVGALGITSNSNLFTPSDISHGMCYNDKVSDNIFLLGKEINSVSSNDAGKSLDGDIWNGEIKVLQSKFNEKFWLIDTSGNYLPRLKCTDGIEHPNIINPMGKTNF